MTTKEEIKAMRKKFRALMEEQNILANKILAAIQTDDRMNITDPNDKLRFYLLEEVSQGISHTTNSLHRLWDTYPEEKS